MLAACLRGEFCFDFLSCTFEIRQEVKVKGSVRFFMYFHLVYSPEFFAVTSGRKWTRKVLRQAAELMVLVDLEFGVNLTYPPFAFL